MSSWNTKHYRNGYKKYQELSRKREQMKKEVERRKNALKPPEGLSILSPRLPTADAPGLPEDVEDTSTLLNYPIRESFRPKK